MSGAASATVPALALRDVVAGFGRLTILRGVSLEVGANEVVVVLGANGAGKTTLFRAIAGLLAPRSGTIELFGQTIAGRAGASGDPRRHRPRAQRAGAVPAIVRPRSPRSWRPALRT